VLTVVIFDSHMAILSFFNPSLPQALKSAVVLTEITMDKMNKTLQDTRMYRRIRSIKDSMMVVGGRGTEALHHLVSSERKLLKEGVLLKACRAKNKPFMFWLFNNCLLYATPMGTLGGSKYQYQFNRVMMLSDCFVRESRVDPLSFELLSAEKSFALWCDTVGEAKEWASALRDAIQEAREAKGLKPEDVRAAAPLWVQESEATACNVCQEAFGWAIVGGRQKHHCRSCGHVVCGSCSGYQLLLPNIHKTRKQRVCVVCFKGGKPVLELEDVSASMTVSASGSGGSNGSEGSATFLGGSLGEQPPTVFAHPTQPLPRPLPTLTKAKTAAVCATTTPSVPLSRPVPPKKPARRSSAESVVPGGSILPAQSTSVVVAVSSAAKAEEQQMQQQHSRSHSRPLSTRLSSSSSRKSLALPPPSPAPSRNPPPPPPPPPPTESTASSLPKPEQEDGTSGTKRVGGMVDELVVGMQRRRELLMTRGGEEDLREQEVEEGGGGIEGATEGGSRLIRARSSDSDSDGWDD